MMKTKLVPVAFAANLIVFQCCASTKGLQRIPVTSNPVGARIIVDGQEAGSTPLSLSLKRDQGHVIRIEKTGYALVEIRVESQPRQAPWGKILLSNVIWVPAGVAIGALLGYGRYLLSHSDSYSTAQDQRDQFIISGAVISVFAVPIVATVVTARLETKPVLTPTTLHVVLEKAGGPAPANIVRITSGELRSLRWIRISYSDAHVPAPRP
jgi:hypothetical protein